MKNQYERRSQTWLSRRSNTLFRLKSKIRLTQDQIDSISLAICKSIPGAQICFGADREISALLVDYWCTNTDLWHDGNAQKIVSDAASLATLNSGLRFTASAFSISDQVEVYNYFVWRQKLWLTNQSQENIENIDTGRLSMKVGKLWCMVAPPIFTTDSEFLTMLIPRYPKLDRLAD
jgi:hypothetical protein